MEEELAPGLYELLVTEALAERLENLKRQGRTAREALLDPAEAPAILARHVGRVTEQVLALVKDDQRIAAANELVRLAGQLAGDDVLAGSVAPAMLTEISSADLGVRFVRPHIPLSRTDLLVNARGEPVLAHELAAELSSADRVDLLCAFIKWHGLRLVAEPLEALCRRGVPVRVITTTYVGATERRAIDELVRIGAEVKISYETQRTRLHAKAWPFHRESGFDTAYIRRTPRRRRHRPPGSHPRHGVFGEVARGLAVSQPGGRSGTGTQPATLLRTSPPRGTRRRRGDWTRLPAMVDTETSRR